MLVDWRCPMCQQPMMGIKSVVRSEEPPLEEWRCPGRNCRTHTVRVERRSAGILLYGFGFSPVKVARYPFRRRRRWEGREKDIRVTVVTGREAALETCRTLVDEDRTFTCSKLSGGQWRFELTYAVLRQKG